jgi:chromosome segregation ATPase
MLKRLGFGACARAHEIFYTDFSDLNRIIATNCREFKEIFADMKIEAELRKLEPSRNVIAHNNPLSLNEFRRVKLCLDDLKKQLKDYAEKRKLES